MQWKYRALFASIYTMTCWHEYSSFIYSLVIFVCTHCLFWCVNWAKNSWGKGPTWAVKRSGSFRKIKWKSKRNISKPCCEKGKLDIKAVHPSIFEGGPWCNGRFLRWNLEIVGSSCGNNFFAVRVSLRTSNPPQNPSRESLVHWAVFISNS